MSLWFNEDPLKIVQGKGQYMYDECGNEYLDCINNVAHVGHANERVTRAVTAQMSLLNTNSRFLHDNLSLYARRLTSLFPQQLSVCYLVNSGSEANDLAIRLARAYTNRTDIVGVDGAYHGNLISTMAISPFKNDHMHNFEREKWAHVAPLPCAYRGDHPAKKVRTLDGFEMYDSDDLSRVGKLYARDTANLIETIKDSGRQVAAFIVESMVSCGGQFLLPPNYLRDIRKYLSANNSLLICDEVQAGFGRCGSHMWAFQLAGSDVLPDIVTIGKPMGNGFPVSAVITTPQIAAAFKNIGTEYFNTFGGNPASCAAALAVLDEMEDRKLVENAKIVGDFILKQMQRLAGSSSIVGDVRGSGFFLGAEIVVDKNNELREPAPELAAKIVEVFRMERILMSTEGKYGNVLKFKPPMVFSMNDAKKFVQVLGKAIAEVEEEARNSTANKQQQQKTVNGDKVRSSSTLSACSTASSSSWLESSCTDDDDDKTN